MLLGQYEAKVDEKSRISLPKKYRQQLGEKIVVTSGFENSLIIVPESEWERLLEGTRGRPFLEYETRDTQRFLLGAAAEIILDSKGRFILPAHLRTYSRIEADVVFIGLGNYVEVWNKETWVKYRKNLETNIEGIAQRLIEKVKEEAK